MNSLNANFRGAGNIKALLESALHGEGRGGREGTDAKNMECPIIEHPNFQDQPLKYIFLLCLKKSIYFWLARLRLKKPLKEK